MFGFACRETPELMPLPIALAHRMARRLAEVRKTGELPYLRPDGKTQVTVEYERRRPGPRSARSSSRRSTTRTSAPSDCARTSSRPVILPTIPHELRDADPVMHVNPTGRFVTGGPMGDAGLTGRKIIVDTYGGMARHGGGAFSRQGSDEGRPVRGVRGPVGGQERGRRRPRGPLRGRGGLRHRDRPARSASRSSRSARGRIPDERIQAAHRAPLRPAPGGHHRGAGPAPADLPPDRGVRSLRSADLDLPWERTDKAASWPPMPGCPSRSRHRLTIAGGHAGRAATACASVAHDGPATPSRGASATYLRRSRDQRAARDGGSRTFVRLATPRVRRALAAAMRGRRLSSPGRLGDRGRGPPGWTRDHPRDGRACDPRCPDRRAFRQTASWPRMRIVKVVSSMIAATALVAGVTPLRIVLKT